MKIALVQQHAEREMKGNIARGLAALEEAARAGADLVAYAELAFSWFLPQHEAEGNVLELAETVPGPITEVEGFMKSMGASGLSMPASFMCS